MTLYQSTPTMIVFEDDLLPSNPYVHLLLLDCRLSLPLDLNFTILDFLSDISLYDWLLNSIIPLCFYSIFLIALAYSRSVFLLKFHQLPFNMLMRHDLRRQAHNPILRTLRCPNGIFQTFSRCYFAVLR